MVPALEAARAVGWDERERCHGRRGQGVGHRVGRHRRQRSQAALLPRAHELPNSRVVRDRRPGRGEREAAACALTAPLDRPGGRSAAASTERVGKPREGVAAGRAELLAACAADDAADGQYQV
jgi:hypothetical protein